MRQRNLHQPGLPMVSAATKCSRLQRRSAVVLKTLEELGITLVRHVQLREQKSSWKYATAKLTSTLQLVCVVSSPTFVRTVSVWTLETHTNVNVPRDTFSMMTCLYAKISTSAWKPTNVWPIPNVRTCLEATDVLAKKDSFSTKKRKLAWTSMSAMRRQHAPTDSAAIATEALFATVNRDLYPQTTARLAKTLTNVKTTHAVQVNA